MKNLFGIYENKELNEVYQLYASLYYDCCDSNLNHFFTRNIDILPITDCETDEEKIAGYKAAIRNIVDFALSAGMAKEQLLEWYPELTHVVH